MGVIKGSIRGAYKRTKGKGIRLDKKTLAKHLSWLKPKHRSVIIKRYDLDGKGAMTMAAIGAQLGVTKQCVDIMEKYALKKLDLVINNKKLLSKIF